GGTAGKEMPIAMMLNSNGQAITLSKDFCGAIGFKDLTTVGSGVNALKAKKEVTFAMTFPGGTHDMWLRYWLAAAGIDQSTVKIITIPPPQMVANMKVGNMDGYCVGEPWGGVAVQEGIGFTQIASQDIWKQHPEKALVVNKEFLTTRREDVKNVMRAVLEASTWIDDLGNRRSAAPTIGSEAYVNAPSNVIDARLQGQYSLGCALGDTTYTDDSMIFSNGGLVNFPRKAHGIWFMAQYVRFGLLAQPPEYQAIADRLIQHDLYTEVATEMRLPIPDDDMSPFTLDLDNLTFDPKDPAASLRRYRPLAA
ncbi:MAG: nitrate/nitrite transport system substrate-binding protein, partial [Chloroflexota bacterium]|nr:nitrate/nitrite transport system substrate-binding protein [Chloroflexota bacterium]